MVLSHKALILGHNRQVQEASLADHRATEASRRSILILAFSEGAVVEAKLFTVLDCFLGKHADTVKPGYLLDLGYCLTVWVAAMAQS